MSWLTLITLIIQLVGLYLRRAEKADYERAFGDALQLSHKERVDRAVRARDDVLSGRVQPDDDDPHRRD